MTSKEEKQLIHAVTEGDIKAVTELLKRRVNIDSRHKVDGKTAIIIASEKGYVDVVELLLSKGAKHDSTYCDKCGFYPLDYAYFYGHTKVINLLKDAGAKLNYESLLRLSVRSGSKEKVTEFLKQVKNINSTDRYGSQMTALHHASELGHTGIVELLLAEKADVNIEDVYGFTPFLYSYLNSHADVSLLLKGTLDYEKLLLLAALKGNMEKLRESLKRSKNINCSDDYLQKTALHHASECGHSEIVTVLLKEGVSVDAKDEYDRTPLHYASLNGHKDVVTLLVSPANVNSKESLRKRTALHIASATGHVETVKLLLDKGADVHSEDEDKNTSLHYASRFGHDDVVDVIVSKSANVNTRNKDGYTPLHWACQGGHVSAVAALLSYPDVDPLAKTDRDKTPMELIPPDHANRTVVLQLFDKFEQCRIDFPVDSYSKVFLCGDSTAGKSSLSQVIKYRADKSPDHKYDQKEVVAGVVPLTAGIEPHTVISNELGHIVLYDFAGHREYYTSHAAIVENLMLQSQGVFGVLCKLTEDEGTIEKNLHYWFNFIENVCAKLSKKVQVIVIGSRADLLSTDGTEYRSLIESIVARSALKNQTYRGFVAVDCHRPGGKGVPDLVELLSQCCRDVIDRSDSISYYCHVQCSFLHDLDEVAITVSDLCDKLVAHNHPSLPSEQARVLEHLTILSDRGLIVFLSNEDPSKSWVVIEKEVLLKEVIGVLFAPEAIKRVHREIASNTGIISVAALKEAFVKYNPKMLVGFLTCLQFCHEIDAEFLNSIDTNVTPHTMMKCGQLLFFPSLIATECPKGITINASFGWCLYCSDPNRFLSTRFLHVLLLLLAHKYSLLKTSGAGEIQKAIPQDIQQHERRCTVWKSGIYWKRENIEVLVEVSDFNRCVTVLLSGEKGTKTLSSVIQKIRYLQRSFSPCNNTEYIIAPKTLANVRTTAVNARVLFSVKSIAKALFLNHSEVLDETGQTSIGLEAVVREEDPFITLSPYVIQHLFAGDPSESLSKDVLQQLHYSCPQVMQSFRGDSYMYQSVVRHLQKFTLFPEGSPLSYAESWMTEEEKKTMSELIKKPTCCQSRKPRLSDLMRFQTNLAYQWNEIGIHLDVPPGVRSGLERSNKSIETQLSEVFQYWLEHGTNHGTMSATWKKLLDVLKDSLQNGQLYAEICQFLGEDAFTDAKPSAATKQQDTIVMSGNEKQLTKNEDIDNESNQSIHIEDDVSNSHSDSSVEISNSSVIENVESSITSSDAQSASTYSSQMTQQSNPSTQPNPSLSLKDSSNAQSQTSAQIIASTGAIHSTAPRYTVANTESSTHVPAARTHLTINTADSAMMPSFGCQCTIQAKSESQTLVEAYVEAHPGRPMHLHDFNQEFIDNGLEKMSVIQFANIIISVLKKSISNLKHFFHQLPNESIAALAINLKDIMPKHAHESFTFRIMMMEFTAGLYINRSVADAIQYCYVFLSAFCSVGGACSRTARFLAMLWNEALAKEYGVDIFTLDSN